VPYPAIEGLPFPGLVRLGRVGVRRLYAWRSGKPYRPVPPLWAMSTAAPTDRADTGTGLPDDPPPATAAANASLPRRMASGLIRRLAIPLTIRSQRNATRRIAVAAPDIVHGMGYMGIPIALDVGRRRGGRVLYDARDIYVDAANLARMPVVLRRLIGRAE